MYHLLTIVGNLGNDPELRYTPSGTPVTTLNVATNRNYSNSAGEDVQETIWWRVAAWNKLAETCTKYLKKGRKVLIEANIRPSEDGNPRVYEKNDGSWGASYEATARVVKFLDPAPEGSGEAAGDDEEVPF